MARPKLIVFDLDYTLWPFWVDTHVVPPFRIEQGVIFDRYNTQVKCFPEVPHMLHTLRAEGYNMAVASRTGCIREAKDLVRLFNWDQSFVQMEIYPDCKKSHFARFHSRSGIPYKDMLFFDDEQRNIRDVSELGVTCIYAEKGMSLALLQHGLDTFKYNNS